MENPVETKKAMLRIITGKKLISPKVFMWPLLSLSFFGFVVINVQQPMSVSRFVTLLMLAAVVISLTTFLAIREVRDMCVDTAINIEHIDMKKWFKVTGVVLNRGSVSITVEDWAQHATTVYSYEVDDTQPQVDKFLVACALKEEWEPIAKRLCSGKSSPIPSESEVIQETKVSTAHQTS